MNDLIHRKPLTVKQLIMLSEQPENYGEPEERPIENDGMRVEARYRGEIRDYWFPRDGVMCRGNQMLVEKAYRIASEDTEKGIMQVRKVQELGELEAVARGYREMVRRKLAGRKNVEGNENKL